MPPPQKNLIELLAPEMLNPLPSPSPLLLPRADPMAALDRNVPRSVVQPTADMVNDPALRVLQLLQGGRGLPPGFSPLGQSAPDIGGIAARKMLAPAAELAAPDMDFAKKLALKSMLQSAGGSGGTDR